MKKLKITLAIVTFALAAMAIPASAQYQLPGVIGLHTALKNATPIVKEAACNGWTGRCGCGPGWVSACRYRCCGCVRCW